MVMLSDIRGQLGNSGSILMIIVLTVADYLWGENVFDCPCGDNRILYTAAFIIVPPVAIIIVDVSWTALCSTCRQNCCCQCDGGCCGSCNCSSNCNFQTWETVMRLTIRPILIAIIWLIFSCMEKKFANCIFRKVPCDCTETELKDGCSISSKEDSAMLRVIAAVAMLGLTALVVLLGLLLAFCRSRLLCTVRCCEQMCSCCDCCTKRFKCIITTCETWTEYDDPRTQKMLTRSLYALGLGPTAVLKLQEQKLMDEKRLMDLSEDSMRKMGDSLSVGQLEILRVHRRDLRLVRCLLENNISKADVKTSLAEAEFLGETLGAVRNELETNGAVSDETIKALRNKLLEYKSSQQRSQQAARETDTGERQNGENVNSDAS